MDTSGLAKPPENRKAGIEDGPVRRGSLLTPENAGGVGFDLFKHIVDGAGVEVVIAVPATVAVGPYRLQWWVLAL